jgi:hypothetical protein
VRSCDAYVAVVNLRMLMSVSIYSESIKDAPCNLNLSTLIRFESRAVMEETPTVGGDHAIDHSVTRRDACLAYA